MNGKTSDLVIDKKALEKMGLNAEALFTLEYDLDSPLKIRKSLSPEQKKELEARNKLAREIRNRLEFILKFHLKAWRHLESSYIINEEKLDIAVKKIEELKTQAKARGFNDIDQRIKIIPIFTNNEGFEHYEDKKAEFLLNFAFEHIRYLEKGIRIKNIAQSTLWRCKQTSEIVNQLAPEIKANPRYNEVIDTIAILDDLIGQLESILEARKPKKDN